MGILLQGNKHITEILLYIYYSLVINPFIFLYSSLCLPCNVLTLFLFYIYSTYCYNFFLLCVTYPSSCLPCIVTISFFFATLLSPSLLPHYCFCYIPFSSFLHSNYSLDELCLPIDSWLSCCSYLPYLNDYTCCLVIYFSYLSPLYIDFCSFTYISSLVLRLQDLLFY